MEDNEFEAAIRAYSTVDIKCMVLVKHMEVVHNFKLSPNFQGSMFFVLIFNARRIKKQPKL